jgi:MFS family permease
VLATTGSASRMGLVLAAEALGIGVCGLPGGHLSARLGARRTLVLANAVAAPLILALPLFHWAGALSFGVLLAIVFAIGGTAGPAFAAQRVALAEILGEDETKVSAANAWLQGATRVTLLLGPSLAGVLIAGIGAPSVLVVDAATFLFAFVTIGLFVPPPLCSQRARSPRASSRAPGFWHPPFERRLSPRWWRSTSSPRRPASSARACSSSTTARGRCFCWSPPSRR